MVSKTLPPWYRIPPPLEKGAHLAIIGGGIAGMTIAEALQEQGYRVSVVEQKSRAMSAASGNPVAILDPFLSAVESPESSFSLCALDHALRYYKGFEEDVFIPTGLKKMALDDKEKQRLGKIFKAQSIASTLLEDDNLLFPDLGMILPEKIQGVLNKKIPLLTDKKVDHIVHKDQWHLMDVEGGGILKADGVILACAQAIRSFEQSRDLPVTPLRGQISYLEGKSAPDSILCAESYLTPPVSTPNGPAMVCGATFEQNSTDCHVRPEDHQENITNARKLWPGVTGARLVGGRAEVRCASPDHMPLCGPLPIISAYQTQYEMLKHGPRHQIFPEAPYYPALYVSSGLGARGFLTAPLLAQTIGAIISGKPLPVSPHIYQALHPARFEIRRLIKA